ACSTPCPTLPTVRPIPAPSTCTGPDETTRYGRTAAGDASQRASLGIPVSELPCPGLGGTCDRRRPHIAHPRFPAQHPDSLDARHHRPGRRPGPDAARRNGARGRRPTALLLTAAGLDVPALAGRPVLTQAVRAPELVARMLGELDDRARGRPVQL